MRACANVAAVAAAVVGLGVDLVEIERVERALQRWGARMVDRLMRPEESARLPSEDPARARAFSLAIGIKEATSKALGTGWTRGVIWRDVELVRGPSHQVRLHGGAAARAQALGAREAVVAALEMREDGLAIAEVWLLG